MTHCTTKPNRCQYAGCGKSYCDARSLRRHVESHYLPFLDGNGSDTSSLTPSLTPSLTSPGGVFQFDVKYTAQIQAGGDEKANFVEGSDANEGGSVEVGGSVGLRATWPSGFNLLQWVVKRSAEFIDEMFIMILSNYLVVYSLLTCTVVLIDDK